MRINLSQLYGLWQLRAGEAKTGFGLLWQDANLRLLTLLALLVNSLNWSVGMFINSRAIDETIVLHHNIYFGITLIGSPREVYFLPFFGLLIIVFNGWLAYLVKEDDRFFIKIFAVSSILINIFLTLGLASIMLGNFI